MQPRIQVLIKHFLLVFSLIISATKGADAQMVGDCAFLQGKYIEVGIAPNGGYGSSLPAPTGYHPNLGGSGTSTMSLYDPAAATLTTSARLLGFVADYGQDGWTVGTPAYFGDYFLPGQPQEGWGIQVNGVNSTAYTSNLTSASSGYTGNISGTTVAYSASGATRSAVWSGLDTNGHLSIRQTTSLDTNNMYFTVHVTIKNIGSSLDTGIYYIRTVDPDNDETQPTGGFPTVNSITYQLPDPTNRVLVSATGATFTNAYLGLGTKDCRAKCTYFAGGTLTPSYTPSVIYSQATTYAYTVGSTATADIGIALVYKLGSLAAGDSTQLTYAYILNSTFIDSALNATSILLPDTSRICQGGSVTLSPGGAVSYTWTPATGLSCTTCANPIASPTVTTEYSVTGVATSGCTITDSTRVEVIPVATDTLIVYDPLSICPGDSVRFATAFTTGASYQWLQNGLPISGATNSNYKTFSGGIYRVRVTNAAGCSDTSVSDTVILNSVPVVPPILSSTGSFSMCVGSTLTLLDATSGGTWFTVNSVPVGPIDPTGVITGLAPGVDSVVYIVTNTCGSASAQAYVVIGASTGIESIVGPTTVCVGSTTTYTDATTGGTWSTSSSGISLSSGGVLVGSTAGTYVLTYSVSGSCGIVDSTITVTVLAAPDPGTINGTASSVCVGSHITLSESVGSGTWSSVFPSIATVSGGIVTGVAAGIDTIKYTVSSTCGSASATKLITVNAAPVVGPINGSATLCVGSNITLTDTSSGGVWSSSFSTIASVTSVGVVTGVSSGIDTIKYTKTSSCGTVVSRKVVTVANGPVVGAITGLDSFCLGSSITLTDTTTSGAWSINPTSVATITSGGVVNGVSAGSAEVTYIVSNSCGTMAVYKAVLVKTIPDAGVISGSSTVCLGANTTLAESSSGGTWTTTVPSIATVTSGGIVTGIALGNDTVVYTVTSSCGTANTRFPIVVSTLPTIAVISGPTSVCQGSTITLVDATSGGTWNTSNATVATVGPTGIVTGVNGGSVLMSYSLSNTCGVNTSTYPISVTPTVSAGTITGPGNVCLGSAITLADTATGGTWISSNPAVATITSSGVVNGVTAGSVTITYSLTGCGTTSTTYNVTVTATPTAGTISGITGPLCVGSVFNLTDGVSGGTWSSSNTVVATITTGGAVTGVTPGTSTISYTLSTSCGTAVATASLSVITGASAGTILGVPSVCVGNTTTLSDTTAGGTWSTSSAAIATISATGVVTGVSTGIVTMSYSIPSSCGTAIALRNVTVSALPNPGTISGASAVCVGSSTTLTETVSGGTWISATPSLATISSSGVVTGLSSGVDTIKYSVFNACGTSIAAYPITISPIPTVAPISGSTTVCMLSSITLSEATPGGVWGNINGNATITAGGIVTGAAIGVDSITYTVTTACGTARTAMPLTILPSSSAGTITGPTSVCTGANITLSDGVSGGTWLSSNAAIATVNSAGVVTGLTAGTVTISYTVTGSCGISSSTYSVAVNTVPSTGSITGSNFVCLTGTTTLGETISGGTWSSSSANATINSGGAVSGVTLGSATISYGLSNACGTAYATLPMNVTNAAPSGTITGANTVCASSSITLADTISGGSWISGNTTVASISTAGVVTGVGAGTTTITYIISSSCGSSLSTYTVTVSPAPVVNAITGTATVCPGAVTTLADATSGGVWTSSTPSVATVGSGGAVTGVSAGTTTISYTVTTSCGSSSVTRVVTVNAATNAGTISGTSTICPATNSTLSATVSGGTWTSSNTGVATVSASGVVTGVTAGTATISYAVSGTCGTAIATMPVTISSSSAGTISGAGTVCSGAAITLTDATSGGVWSSSDAGVATVGATGVVTGVSTGSATISYTVTSTCGSATATAAVTVSGVASAGSITGTTTVCTGANTTLSDATTGGTWSSSNTAVATVSATGVVTGVTAGTVTISYNVISSCGSATATTAVTVNPSASVAAISGTTSVCLGLTSTLVDATSGGVWSSSAPATASVSSSGVVTGLSAGSANISYTVTNSCGSISASVPVSVNSTPSAGTISGAGTVCSGSTLSLTDGISGGVWSSSNAAVASINASGVVTGLSLGSANISYVVTTGCGTATTTASVTVSATASAGTITGTTTVCQGATTPLSESMSGGSWSSSNTAVATVNASGVVTGVSSGTANITYTITSSCGTSSTSVPVTVNPLPSSSPVTPSSANICVGTNTTLSDASSGGTWTSSNTSIATVNASGVVTAVATGSVIITYAVTNACGSGTSTSAITVSPVANPGTIGGTTAICLGSTSTLTETTPGGVWTTSNAAVASVSASGVVTGVTAGSATITYTVTTGCASAMTSTSVTISPALSAGTVTPSSGGICVGATLTLTDAVSGGTWTTTNAAIATVSAAGIVTGTGSGVATISYSATNACGTVASSATVTVSSPASAGSISGPSAVCLGSNITLGETASGGTWSSSATTIAPIGATGVVSGASVGTATITYSVTTGCSTATTTTNVTVLPSNAGSISGPTTVCTSTLITLSDAVSGGVWTSSASGIANVDPSTGLVVGISAGSATITYTVTNICGTFTATYPMTVTPSVSAGSAGTISGTTTLCQGTSTDLSDAAAGGTWSSSNSAVASVTFGGVVVGVSAGTATISYTVTNSCGTDVATTSFTVNPAPAAGTISGPANVCVGLNISLSDAIAGGSWTSSNPASATVSATGVVTGVALGFTTITYTVTNSCGTATVTDPINVGLAPLTGGITGSTAICFGTSTTLTDAASGGTWSSSNPAIATVSASGVVNGLAAGNATISYSVTSSCATLAATAVVAVSSFPNAGTITGTATACVGGTTSLSDTAVGGVWSSGAPAIATVSSTGVVTAVSTGIVNIYYSVTNACGSTNATISINVSAAPSAGAITGTTTVCQGAITTLADAVSGGVWSSSNTAIATVSASGVVTGVSGGTATISYTITGSCGATSTTAALTVNPLPATGAISGAGAVCVGATQSLTESMSGGVWSSATTSIATVSATGIVTGVAAGVDTILYTLTNACGSSHAVAAVTVTGAPSAGTISGASSICSGTMSTLIDGVAGGTWSSSNTAIASVDAGGVVTGVANGAASITYSVTDACGTGIATRAVSVNGLPDPGLIIATTTMCAGAADTFVETMSGGVWSSSNPSVATVTSFGLVTAVASGSAIISYVTTNTCGSSVATADLAVNPSVFAAPITGTTNICVTTPTTLSDATTGGVWSSSNTSVATINSSTGVVSGVGTGITTISYHVTSGCGSAVSTTNLTVNSAADAGIILGTTMICTGTLTTLTTTGSGGTWSSSDTSLATVSSTGVVSAIASGSAIISYTSVNVCGASVATADLSIAPGAMAGTLSGAATVCHGGTTSLTASIGGGTWTSSSATTASVDASGVVTGMSVGSATISYSVSSTCGVAVATHMITVDTLPLIAGSITGGSSVCVGSNTSLSDATAGGTWSSSNAGVASVSTTGVVTGVAAGAATISYDVTNACGSAVATTSITASTPPSGGIITGASSLCVGATSSYTESMSGGTWTSSDATVATISASGLLTAVAAGTINVNYNMSASCGTVTTSLPVTVNAAPAVSAIAGAGTLCAGSSATLTDATTGGTWSSSNPAIFTVSTTGVITAVSAGVATVGYTVSGAGSCTTTVSHSDTVISTPSLSAIAGAGNICAGSSSALTDATTGGTWSSSNSAIASVTSGGIVTGASIGSATITYTVGIAGCSASVTATETVNPAPTVSAITGAGAVCVGATRSLADVTASGVWSVSTPSRGTISTSGVVTALAPGMDTVYYTVTNSFGCGASASAILSINAGPSVSAISGSGGICAGASAALTEATAGGTWSSSNPAVATIDAAGIVTAVSSGTTMVSYTVTSAGCVTTVSAMETVNALPTVAAISGSSSMCLSGIATLNDATMGGVWSSSNTAVATISTSGVVSPVAVGTATISYTYTNASGCSATATFAETIDTGSVSGFVTPMGAQTLCHGNPVAMTVSSSTTGLTYQWYHDGTAISGATSASYSATATGAYSVMISNGSCGSMITGTSVVAPPAPIIHAGTGSTIYTGSFVTYQWMMNGHPVPGATSSVLTTTTAGTYNVIVTDASGCADTSGTFTVSGTVVNNVVNINSMDIKLYPNPATSVIIIDAPIPVNASLHTIDCKIIGRFADAKTIDVSSLPSAMYLIMVYDTDGNLLRTDKFIKE